MHKEATIPNQLNTNEDEQDYSLSSPSLHLVEPYTDASQSNTDNDYDYDYDTDSLQVQSIELTENEEKVFQANQELIQSLLFENKKLRRANSKLKNESRRKGRTISDLKKRLKKLQPRTSTPNKNYRNGKRGTQFNG